MPSIHTLLEYHSDLKSANILLDEHKKAMIADFGSWVSPETYDRTTAQSTIGYTAPEYVNDNVLSLSCDVYSVGVIVLEVLTGMKAIDNSRADKSLAAWVANVMKSGMDLTADASLMECSHGVSSKADSRPDISDVANLFSSLVRAGNDRDFQRGIELKMRTVYDKMITPMAKKENQDAQAAEELRERCLKLLAQD